MTFAFIDIETTGLDRWKDEVWEVGVVIDHTGDDTVVFEQQFRIEPSYAALEMMSEEARRVNGYDERTTDPTWRWDDEFVAARELRDLLDGATLVAANPDFDCDFLRRFFRNWTPNENPEPWHHRKLDVESMFFQHRWGGSWPPDRPVRAEGMKAIREVFQIPEPVPHTALQDARDVRRVFRQLMGG